jgi:hypothetical protein
MGYVYLLLETDKDGNERHKIGFTKNHPEKRVKQLKTGNSNIISLLNFYQSTNYKRIEHWLHGDFANQKTQADNEWFMLTNEDVIGFIDKCKKIDETITLLLEHNPFYR